MNISNIQVEINNLSELYSFESVAQASNGSVLYASGGTRILASVCVQSNKLIEGDFVPLSVQYIQKAYACGKFPSGFIKREGKPNDFEILTSRLIDRSLRPLFPKGFGYVTHIVVMVLSYDGKSDLALGALHAAASALYVSNIGIKDMPKMCVSAVRLGRINGEFIINPTKEQRAQSELDLFVSGKDDELLMIEMNTGAGVSVLAESVVMEALELAKQSIAEDCKRFKEAFVPFVKPSLELELKNQECKALGFLEQECRDWVVSTIARASKSERADAFDEIIAHLMVQGYDEEDAKRSLGVYKKSLVREMILRDSIRADGRGLKEVRPISIVMNPLPCAHSSVLFTRGQTQALVVCTLGGDNDAQSIEPLGESPQKDKFLFHYNFPSFSVGEVDMIGSVGRRELGHGNLARKALRSSIVDSQSAIRLVSEILESNGSSSMASVCGGSLALQACGVQMRTLIAGVAMGLITQGEEYAVLTDITGLEDHDGDMDFKVAGDEEGISALQMDIKLGGISSEILKNALMQAKEARVHILGIMREALKGVEPNYEVLPKMVSFPVSVHKMVDIIGQGGKTIKGIIERFNVSIDLDREQGNVHIHANTKDELEGAKNYILELVREVDFGSYHSGMRFRGKVKKVLDFGAFVELPNGGDGLLHISKFTNDKSKKMSEILGEMGEIECEIVSVNGQKVELKAVEI
ncbi:polyribonucleotide nucleotidyltransferase [uncultured Helicobacter sp.]|uniref:polyribonucleotide nucleotidyltransferase n=1 Tax=uncultured Helicobacter sp. TaxID=175537 RepID=UPI00374E9EC8